MLKKVQNLNLGKNLLFTLLIITFFVMWNNFQNDSYREEGSTLIDGATDLYVDRSVWGHIRQSFQLDHHAQSPAVQKEIRSLLSDRVELMRILKDASPYLYYITNQVKQKNLPAELALIPFVESEFNPNDHSNKGATGLWQLMYGTAKDLGVKVGSGYDGRKNIPSSTEAALLYFKGLGNMFNGNWYLAIAAYNCGQGCVMSAKKKTGSDDFWALPLPTETKRYVPRLMAISEIVENPSHYGVTLPPIKNKPFFTEVKISKNVTLDGLSQKANIDIDTLKRLNPDYTHKKVIPTNSSHLLVPTSKVTALVQTRLV